MGALVSKMGLDGTGQKHKDVAALRAARLDDRQHRLHKTAARRALRPKRQLLPATTLRVVPALRVTPAYDATPACPPGTN